MKFLFAAAAFLCAAAIAFFPVFGGFAMGGFATILVVAFVGVGLLLTFL